MRASLSSAVLAPKRRALRGAALALALLAAVAQLGGLLHLTLVQHVTCPEHGELIHAEAGAEFYTLSLSAPAGEGERQSVTSGTEAEHEHDHCPVLLSRREDAAAATPRVCPFADLPRLAGLTAPAESPHAQVIAILHLAPKNSPTPL